MHQQGSSYSELYTVLPQLNALPTGIHSTTILYLLLVQQIGTQITKIPFSLPALLLDIQTTLIPFSLRAVLLGRQTHRIPSWSQVAGKQTLLMVFFTLYAIVLPFLQTLFFFLNWAVQIH